MIIDPKWERLRFAAMFAGVNPVHIPAETFPKALIEVDRPNRIRFAEFSIEGSTWMVDTDPGTFDVLYAPIPKVFVPVVIESPYAGNRLANLDYLNRCILHALRQGETPYASHLMLTGALDDMVAAQRALGIEAGLQMGAFIRRHAFYIDRGWSTGMKMARDRCEAEGRQFSIRSIKGPTIETDPG